MSALRDDRFRKLDELIKQGKGDDRDLTPLRKQAAKVGRPENLPTSPRKTKTSGVDWQRISLKFVIPQRAVFERIAKAVEKAYDYPPGTLRAVVSNETKYVHPRYVCFYLCRLMTKASYPQLARYFNANHTTIINGCDHVKGCMQHSKDLLELLQSLVAEIKSDPKWFEQ